MFLIILSITSSRSTLTSPLKFEEVSPVEAAPATPVLCSSSTIDRLVLGAESLSSDIASVTDVSEASVPYLEPRASIILSRDSSSIDSYFSSSNRSLIEPIELSSPSADLEMRVLNLTISSSDRPESLDMLKAVSRAFAVNALESDLSESSTLSSTSLAVSKEPVALL